MQNLGAAVNCYSMSLTWAIEKKPDKSRIPLHYAVQHPDTYLTRLFIKYGAHVDASDYSEATPAHFVAKEGRVENACILLTHGAEFCCRDKYGRTALDVAAEEGHVELLQLLIRNSMSTLIRILNTDTRIVNSPLHLAARNGHVEIVNILLTEGEFPINLVTSNGTALHEAVLHGRVQVVRLLLHKGINQKLLDQDGRTAADVAVDSSEYNPVSAPLILQLLTEALTPTYGIAVRDYFQDRQCYESAKTGSRGGASQLPLKVGEVVWILGNPNSSDKIYWQGITFSARGFSRCGYFPRRAVRIVRPLPGKELSPMGYEIYRKHNGDAKRKVKKVEVPRVPMMNNSAVTSSATESVFNSSNTTDYHTDSGSNASDRHSYYTNSSAPLPGLSPTPSRAESLFDSVTVASFPDDDYSCTETVAVASNPMSRSCSTAMQHANSYGSIANSYSHGSSDSHSSDGFAQRRTKPMVPTRSSSNSLNSQFSNIRSASSGLIDNSPAATTISNSTSRSSNATSPGPSIAPSLLYRMALPLRGQRHRHKVADMVIRGIPETEIIAEWLNSLGLTEYLQLFVVQGYDLASIARVTPQDLITLGITLPDHRRKMIQDIQEWHITDGYPSYVPGSNGIRDFLTAIGLQQYINTFEKQNFKAIRDLEELSYEDFEDVGVKKLGHMKRLFLALKKLKTNREARQQQQQQQAATSDYGTINTVNHDSNGHNPMETHFNMPPPSYNYPTGTLTSRSSSAIGDCRNFVDGGSFQSAQQQRPSRMSMPNEPARQRSMVFPSQQAMPSSARLPRSSPAHQLSTKDIHSAGSVASSSSSQDSVSSMGLNYGQAERKLTKLNLVTMDQILSKLDDIENDSVISMSMAEDFPPSPAPLSCNMALERLRAMKLPGEDDSDNESMIHDFDFKEQAYQFINGTNTFSSRPMMEHANSDSDELSGLGQMLRDLTDELDAQLHPCGSTTV
uniref:Caskin-2 n=1 Tax=Panagrellus redivivus TaxID=6233 RepID=A0A7E4UQQ0_PANRE